MKKDIVINKPTPNPAKNNPNSYRFKCRYKDQHDGLKIKTTSPRWKDEKEANEQRAQWLVDYGGNKGHFSPPEVKAEPEPEKPLTFRKYAESYQKWKKHEIKGKAFDYEMRRLIDRFGDMPLSAIDYDEIKLFRSELEQKFEKKIIIKSPHLTLNPKTAG